jgi:hypothetical protein
VDLFDRLEEGDAEGERRTSRGPGEFQTIRDGGEEIPQKRIEEGVLGLLSGVVGGPVLGVALPWFGFPGVGDGNADGERQMLHEAEDVLAGALTIGEVRAVAEEVRPVEANSIGATGGLGTDLVEARGEGGDSLRLPGQDGATQLAAIGHGSRRTARTRFPTQCRGTRTRPEVAQGLASFSTTS